MSEPTNPAIIAAATEIAAASFPNVRDQRDVLAQAAARVPSRLALKKAERELKKTATAALVEKHKLYFVYIRKYHTREFPFLGEMKPHGGMVIVYHLPLVGGKIVEVSTAVCNKKDIFDKVEGRFLAAKAFDEGKKVKVVTPSGSHYGQNLKIMFEV